MSPGRGMNAAVSGAGNRLRVVEARYVQAVQGHRAIPSGNEHAEARCRAWTAIKAAEREVIDCLWASAEMQDAVGLGRYVETYRLALEARVA